MTKYSEASELMESLNLILRTMEQECSAKVREQVLGTTEFAIHQTSCIELRHLVGRVREMQEDLDMMRGVLRD